MDYRGLIESKLEQNNGILSSRDIKALNIPSIYLTRMVNEGILNRVSRGMYLRKWLAASCKASRTSSFFSLTEVMK